MIYNRQDSVEPITKQKLGNQVQRYYLEGHRFWWDWDSIEGCLFGVRDWFILLAYRTAFNVFSNPASHACPIVGLGY